MPPAADTSVSRETTRLIVERLMREGGIREIQIQTHYGATPLPVSEIWLAGGTLHIAVEVPTETP